MYLALYSDHILVVCCSIKHIAMVQPADPIELPKAEAPSYDKLVQRGWLLTRDLRYSCNGQLVWLCPECANDLLLELLE